MYTFQDSSSLTTSQGGKFGLNQKVFLTEFMYVPADGTSGEYISLKVKVEDKEYNTRLYPPTKVYKDNVEITDVNSEDYKKGMEKANKIYTAMVTDVVKCFVPEETIKTALSTPIPDFKTYAGIVTKLVNQVVGFDKKELDLFLQYQFAIKGSSDRTWLEIPVYKNSYQGLFITSHVPGNFKEVPGDSLKYKTDEGVEHPFVRNSWFMGSNYAKVQKLESTSETSSEVESVFGDNTEGGGNSPW